MDGECLYTTKGRTLALLRRVVCGAYSIRPYTGHENAVRLGHIRASNPHFLVRIAHTSMIPPQNEGYA